MAFMEIEGLEKICGAQEVLKGIDLQVERHQVVSLIGASGSGKSTLLRGLNALNPINAGQNSIDGDVVSGPGVDQNRLRRKVGMVFQRFSLSPHLSVEQNIMAEPMYLLGETREAARNQARAGQQPNSNRLPPPGPVSQNVDRLTPRNSHTRL